MSERSNIIELNPCGRDEYMISLCSLLCKHMQVCAREPYQTLSLSKMRCLIVDFPMCRTDESLSLELVRNAFTHEKWKITRSWELIYDGKVYPSDKEPCINLVSKLSYCEEGGLIWKPVELFLWSMPLHEGESVGLFRDGRKRTPFSDKLKSIGEDINSISRLKNGQYSNHTLLTNYSFSSDDSNNKWQPTNDSLHAQCQLGVTRSSKSNPMKDTNGDPIPSYEDQVMTFLSKQTEKSMSEQQHVEVKNCHCCGSLFSKAMAKVDSEWLCIECWAEKFREKNSTAEIYTRETWRKWSFQNIIRLQDVQIVYKH